MWHVNLALSLQRSGHLRVPLHLTIFRRGRHKAGDTWEAKDESLPWGPGAWHPVRPPRRERTLGGALLPRAGVPGPCHRGAACLHADDSNFISSKRSWKEHLRDITLDVTLEDAQTATEPVSWQEPGKDLTIEHYRSGGHRNFGATGTVTMGLVAQVPTLFYSSTLLLFCFSPLFCLIFLLWWALPLPP